MMVAYTLWPPFYPRLSAIFCVPGMKVHHCVCAMGEGSSSFACLGWRLTLIGTSGEWLLQRYQTFIPFKGEALPKSPVVCLEAIVLTPARELTIIERFSYVLHVTCDFYVVLLTVYVPFFYSCSKQKLMSRVAFVMYQTDVWQMFVSFFVMFCYVYFLLCVTGVSFMCWVRCILYIVLLWSWSVSLQRVCHYEYCLLAMVDMIILLACMPTEYWITKLQFYSSHFCLLWSLIYPVL